MKILLATPIYPPEIGGPAEYARELPRQLAGVHEVKVLAYSDLRTTPEVITVPKSSPLPLRLMQFFFALWSESTDAGVIYAQNAVAAGLPAVLVGRLRGIRTIIKFVGDEAWERARQSGATEKNLEDFLARPNGGIKAAVIRTIQGFVLRRADVVTTPSAYLGTLITTTYRLNPQKVVTNYNAATPYQPLSIALNKPHQLATAVRLTKWKGVDGILDAVALLVPQFPDIHLVIAGDGPERKSLEERADAKGIRAHVTFRGTISREETELLFAESAATVLNSTYEGLPFGVLMSFAVSTPVIATNISGTNEVVQHGTTGLLVEPQNPEALAEAITTLFQNDELAKKLACGGSELLVKDFSWKAHLARLEAMFVG